MKVQNKVIIVTGAGSGMGREISLNLLQKGAKVVGIDLNADTLSETKALAEDQEANFLDLPINITHEDKINDLPKIIIDHFGSVDGLINNAGIIQPFIHVKDLDMKDIRRVMDVNFYGTLYLTKALLPYFLERPEAHIVNISSMGGFLPVPGQTIYGASKAAVKLFTEGLYSELKGTKVYVTVIFPGAIATNISKNSGLEVPASGTNEASEFKAKPAPEAAEEIIQAMEKNKFRATIGKDAGFLDKLYRFFPHYAVNFIQKKMKSLLN